MTVFIGDVHSKYRRYKRIMRECTDSIQVGDIGLGFRRRYGVRAGEWHSNPPHHAMKRGNHRFIRGNHDNPAVCREHSQYIADGTVEGGMMFVGGAASVDRMHRLEGYDYWSDEELNIPQLNDLIDKFVAVRPRVMVTHDCPEELAKIMCAMSGRVEKRHWPSRTREAFQTMWSAHSPDIWIFGHWHFSFDSVANGTRFICLAECEAREIDVT